MTELEARIIGFVAEERGMKPQRIILSSRLYHDLGMDGDDAVEFFEKFGKDFNVDLSPLREHWSEHFGPEGSAPSLGCMVVIGVAVVLGDLLHRVFQFLPSWAWMIVLLIAFGWAYHRIFASSERDDMLSITVVDLVEAVSHERWTKQYGESANLFRTLH
jgi:hypothetical protein